MDVDTLIAEEFDRIKEAIDARVIEGRPAVERAMVRVETVGPLRIEDLQHVDSAFSRRDTEGRLVVVILDIELAVERVLQILEQLSLAILGT